MSRDGSQLFHPCIFSGIYFSSSQEKSKLEKFIYYAENLFKNNNQARELIFEAQPKNIHVAFVAEDNIFSFGYFSCNHILIRDDLNEFEKTIVLLVELCNVNNAALQTCLSNVSQYESKEAYANACECAEYASLKRAADIYRHGFEKCGWPDFQKTVNQLRSFYILFNMNLQTYLLWSKTPRVAFNNQSHSAFYEKEYVEIIKNNAPN